MILEIVFVKKKNKLRNLNVRNACHVSFLLLFYKAVDYNAINMVSRLYITLLQQELRIKCSKLLSSQETSPGLRRNIIEG